MRYKSIIIVALAVLIAACGEKQKRQSYDTIGASGLTTRTENLRDNLFAYQQKGIMIGQAYGTCSAVGEMSDSLGGDILKTTSDLPSCVGFSLDGIERGDGLNADSVPFATIRSSILAFFKRQGLVLLSWTMPDCRNDEVKNAENLSKIAHFIGSLHDAYGIKVPVVVALCPLGHGQWYDSLSASEYKNLYSQTVNKLRSDTLTNALFAFSNGGEFGSAREFMERCPDNDIALVQLEMLSDDSLSYGERLKEKAQMLSDACNERMTAFGIYGGVRGMGGATFLSDNILPTIQSVQMSYFMFGMNSGEPSGGNYYLPFAGHEGVADFMKLYNDKRTVFARGLNGLLVSHDKAQK